MSQLRSLKRIEALLSKKKYPSAGDSFEKIKVDAKPELRPERRSLIELRDGKGDLSEDCGG